MLTDRLDALVAECNRLANAQFATPEFQHLLGMPLTIPRAQCYLLHMAHYVRNRRDCWGYVMGAAPIPVKRLIWAHEQEELIRDPRANTDHSTLAAGEAGLVGLTHEQIEQAELLPGAVAAFQAWILLAKDRPWLEAFAASSMLERRNDSAVIDGGGMSYRRGMKLQNELGIKLERNTNATVHMQADVDHAAMLEEVASAYATGSDAREALLRGARATYVIDRAFIGAIADAMEKLS